MFFFTIIFISNLTFYIYGKIFLRLFFKKEDNFHQSEIALYGTILLSFLAVFINFFVPLSEITNSAFLIVPLLFLLKYKSFNLNDLKFLFLSSVFVSAIIVFSNINTPDAALYHLPYTHILNENKLIIGLSNLHFRFGHISVIQYLSALNYNIITGFNGILIPVASLMVFIFLYFINDVYNFVRSKAKISINNSFSLFIVCYISYKINRYSGFGNDAIAHLLFFYLISIFLKSNHNYANLQKSTIISVYIILNKVTLILALLFPLILFFKCKEKKIKIFYSFPFFLMCIWIFKNILISSCLFYPVEKTCYNQFIWSDKNELINQSISGEAWAKGWPDRLDKNIDQKSYIEKFNWIKSWYSVHFKYIVKTVFPYLILLLLINLMINYSRTRNNINTLFFHRNKFKILSTIFVLLVGNIIFFIKFPLYRYGYSYLISMVSFLFSITIFSYNEKFTKKVFKYVLIFSITVFLSKQLLRIYDNYNLRTLFPSTKTSLKIEEKVIGRDFKFYLSNSECMYINSPCTNIINNKLDHKKILNYDVIFINKKL
tara:strand:- start:1716 stop:3350 length:1635 start_codon:yes stop_codon:yes gene_type:complete